MKKKWFCILGCVMLVFLITGCGGNNAKDNLTASQIQSIAEDINEKVNFGGDLSNVYNLQYSNFDYETDGYNRYIVTMHYQYENKKRNYCSNDIIVHFRWLTETEEYQYSYNSVRVPSYFFSEADWIENIKNDEEFGWGTNTEKEAQQPSSELMENSGELDNKTIEKISFSVENKPVSYSGIKPELTWGDIFYYSTNKERNISPSDSNLYGVELSVAAESIFNNPGFYLNEKVYEITGKKLNGYHVEYEIWLGDVIYYLCYVVSYDLNDITLFMLNKTDVKTEETLYAYMIGDSTPEQMERMFLDDMWFRYPDIRMAEESYDYVDLLCSIDNVTNDNFEQVVALELRENYHDNNIMNMCVEENIKPYDEEYVSYTYIGTNYTDFSTVDYTFFDVYRIDYSNGAKSYYLLPFNEYSAPPMVYSLISDGNFMLVWTAEV